jgi:hypothetical protein
MTELQDLRHEHDQVRVGPLIEAEVRALVRQVVSAYPPTVYAGSPAWTSEAINDLAQDVFTYWLLEQGQITYILGAARTMSDFRALLVRTTKRALAHRRVRSVIDNLLARCRELLAAEPFETIRIGGRDVFRRRGAGPYAGDATEDQLRAAELRAMTIPRRPPERGERASAVYSKRDLQALLMVVASSIPTGFKLSDLDRILRRVLTPWIVGSLVSEEVLPAAPSPELSPEEVMLVNDAIARILRALTGDQKALLGLFLANANDAEIAAALGLKARQTIIKRRAEVANVLAEYVEGLPRPVADSVVGGLAVALATSGGGSDA